MLVVLIVIVILIAINFVIDYFQEKERKKKEKESEIWHDTFFKGVDAILEIEREKKEKKVFDNNSQPNKIYFRNSNSDKIRTKFRESFKEEVQFAIKNIPNNTSDSFMYGMVIQIAINNIYNSLKDSDDIARLSSYLGVDYKLILEEELQYALKTYLK